MTFADALGWAACLMTLATFAQQRMIPLRIAAILANLCFIGYGALGHYLPVLTLHLTLLPVNGQRLFSLLVRRENRQPAATAVDSALLDRERVGNPGGRTRGGSRAASVKTRCAVEHEIESVRGLRPSAWSLRRAGQ